MKIRVAVGPAAWDLVSVAVLSKSVPWITGARYDEFVAGYGHDVSAWTHYADLRDIRELRMTCYVMQLVHEHPSARQEASLRIDCLRGRRGARLWPWVPM
jgi:hypothetical protein